MEGEVGWRRGSGVRGGGGESVKEKKGRVKESELPRYIFCLTDCRYHC